MFARQWRVTNVTVCLQLSPKISKPCGVEVFWNNPAGLKLFGNNSLKMFGNNSIKLFGNNSRPDVGVRFQVKGFKSSKVMSSKLFPTAQFLERKHLRQTEPAFEPSSSERRGNIFTRFKDLYLKAKARIWCFLKIFFLTSCFPLHSSWNGSTSARQTPPSSPPLPSEEGMP